MDFRRTFGLLLPFALLAVGERQALASAGPRLVAPEAGAELRAGTLAVVAWEDPPPKAEEWEAFLSLDGGRTYPLRITPHLDLGIRRFAFAVPPFPTREARVLLRFGDERREVGFETPHRFAIALSETYWPPGLDIALSPGERPRPRDSGVVVWVEGARDGSGLRQRAAATESSSLHSVAPSRLPWMLLAWPTRQRADRLATPDPAQIFHAPLPGRAALEAGASPPLRPSVRLLTGRRNE
jgi:hypothetical protein